MADSAVKTTDNRAAIRRKEDDYVWEIVLTFFTDTGGHAEQVVNIPFNGIIRSIVAVLPATTATGLTSTVTIDDNSDAEVFNTGALAENATHVFNLDLPLSGTIDISLDMSADPTGSGVSNVVTIRGI